MSQEIELLRRLYAGFNAREMESVLAAMHEDVLWANGMEGGYVNGREGVRAYWTRQWATIDPHVEPVAFSAGSAERLLLKCTRRCAVFREMCWRTGWSCTSLHSMAGSSGNSIFKIPQTEIQSAGAIASSYSLD